MFLCETKSSSLHRSVRGGRIECTMQNVADMLVNQRESPLSPRNHGESRNQCSTGIIFF